MNLVDKYYTKALDQYPYDLEEVSENLNYALSYDPNHPAANILMGRFCLSFLKNPQKAEAYFVNALAYDSENLEACYEYILLLIQTKAFEQVEKLIAYTQGIKGVDLSRLYHLTGLKNEHQYIYDKAKLYFKKAILDTYEDERIEFLNAEIKRVIAKEKLKSKIKEDKAL